MMMKGTLRSRLVLTSLAWIVFSLTITGAFLVWSFQAHIERRFDANLLNHMEELVAAATFDDKGGLVLSWRPSDPQFEFPQSGWYWQIFGSEGVVAGSPSVLDNVLPLKRGSLGNAALSTDITGPENVPLRAVMQRIVFPGIAEPLVFAVAGPKSDIRRDVWKFGGTVVSALVLLGVSLVGVVFVQVRFGLRPLRELKRKLGEVRSGEADTLPETFPEEVQPVISELNELLSYNAALLLRARSQVGNLAHALKTPLTILRSEFDGLETDRDGVLHQQLALVNDNIDHYLTHARISGGRVLGQRTNVEKSVADLVLSMRLLHKDKNLQFRIQGMEGRFFQGDPQDFEEMVGNILDNACKWGRSLVSLQGEEEGRWLTVTVEDDGPGIAPEQWSAAIQRGLRLDETKPGTGLGLGIAREIAEVYGGTLDLSRSDVGGLSVRLKLPAAPR